MVRLSFDDSVSADPTSSAGCSNNVFFSSTDFGFPPEWAALTTIDNAFLDWNNALTRVAGRYLARAARRRRQGGSASTGRIFPVQFGPFGLFVQYPAGRLGGQHRHSNGNVADGLRVALHLANLADLQLQSVLVRIAGTIGALSYPRGENAYGVDANIKVAGGLRLGAYYVGNSIGRSGSTPFAAVPGAPSVLYHVYGPACGSVNPATAHCPAASGGVKGIACPALGNGFGGV